MDDTLDFSALEAGAVYDRALVKQVLLASKGDPEIALDLLRAEGKDDATIERIASQAATDVEIFEDPEVGDLIRIATGADQPVSPSDEPTATNEVLPVTPVPTEYDREFVKRILSEADGDLNQAVEILLAQGFDESGLKMLEDGIMQDQALIEDPEYASLFEPLDRDEIPEDASTENGFESRFETIDEAIAFAETNGQGELTVGPDGQLTNRFGEIMVYDSDGNLAPAPNSGSTAPVAEYDQAFIKGILDQAAGDLDQAVALLFAQGFDETGLKVFEEGIMQDQALLADPMYGQFFAPLIPADASAIPDEISPETEFESRFETTDEAIAFAETNGQGELTVGPDGQLTNRFGEIMVYDSDGNLAPAPRSEEDTSNTDDESGITAPVDPGNAAEQPQESAYDSRFESLEDALDFAENNGQGELEINDAGVITNQNNEVMVYDSEGNLAPAPRPAEDAVIDYGDQGDGDQSETIETVGTAYDDPGLN